MTALSENHFYWMRLLGELRAILLKVEAGSQAALKAKSGQDIDAGVWVEVFDPELPFNSPYGGGTGGGGEALIVRRADPRERQRRGGTSPNAPLGPGGRTPSRPTGPANTSPDTVSRINLTLRLVNRRPIMVSANEDLAFAVQAGLNASSYFTNATLGDLGIEADQADTNTFTFTINVGLKHPFKL